jgi:hypothetical protein
MGCKTRKYSDGGKVLAREYMAGEPTYFKALKARVGLGDGYGKPKKRVFNIENAREGMVDAISKKKKALDET